jgi:23S rRNA (adenine2503-C2)-methyltransferase
VSDLLHLDPRAPSRRPRAEPSREDRLPQAQPTPLREGRRLLLDLGPGAFEAEVGAVVRALGEPAYRVRQIRDGVTRRLAGSFAELTDLPAPLRAELDRRFVTSSLEVEERAVSSDGTEKFLWRLADGREVESVSIPSRRKLTFCISSQVGCPLACSFCATGKLGYRRQLTAGEIVDQVREMLRRTAPAAEGRDREPNLVFMGMGEPLLNLRNLFPALRFLNAPEFLAIGARRITVSTSGVAPAIPRLAEFNPQLKLAISLHAPNDALRDVLVPLNRRHPLSALLEACRAFARATGKRITFEYVHLPGVNDLPEHAPQLASLLAGLPCKVNLIPYNPVPGLPYRAPTEAESEAFTGRLRAAVRCSVTLRRPRGRDIAAACGQLELERHPEALPQPPPVVAG